MELYNYMEDIVKNVLEALFSKRDDICKCDRCRLDIVAWALNRLPPRYIVTDKGRLYAKLKEQEVQFRADVVTQITAAITHIAREPHR